MSPERRRELHLRLATVLERAEVPEPETLARHYRAAGDVFRALVWTRSAAANATATLAFARAVELYMRAAELALSPAQRLDVLDQLAEAQVMLGRRSDAALTVIEASELAAGLGRSADHAALRARAGEYFLLAGQLWARLASGSALGAFAAGQATRSETLERIHSARDQVAALPAVGGHFVIAAHACIAAGDRAGAVAAYETAAARWKGTHQSVFEHCARLRRSQLVGDEASVAATVLRLRELGVGDPDQFANVFAGPLGPR